ncbi:hypothetical protein NQ314_020754 [Rhamnusium bicolor]|uniref:Serpin domain-containing protein n=1 Tax=Rhamnusium bicolor TaxID=1586634 RepID=A0AAV8WKS3_9CUCU|nr:hypothetical protein NQ314_020754 [Rhamnusium bicolor]
MLEAKSENYQMINTRNSLPNTKNVLLSPISLKLILALLYQGSSGPTEREFQNVLQFYDKKTVNDDYSRILSTLQASERSEYLLNMGTCIFLDSQIPANPNYEMKANRYYRTEIKPTTFLDSLSASQVINSWVEKITNGKVSKMVQPGDLQETIMLITNAVYFKGTWTHQFPKNQTHLGKFVVSSEDINNILTVTIPYMSTTDQFFMKESQELDSKILRLPYKQKWEKLYRTLDYIKCSKNTASFTGITKGNNSLLRMLVVSDIVQKSGIELDEEGSVVYSATDVNIGNKFGEPRDIFNATHPFLFFIEGPNGSILFNGKVENPLEEESLPIPTRLGDDDEIPAKVPAGVQALSDPQYFTSVNQNAVPTARPVSLDFPQGQKVPNLQPNVPNLASNLGPNLAPNLEPSSFEPETVDKEELIYRFNLFDVELLNEFADSSTNVFISPASIKTTLAMILEGAKGSCALEISEALRIPNLQQKGVREILMGLLNTLKEKSSSTYLENSNAVFASDKYRVLDKYRKTIEQFYGGNVKSVNFKNIANAVATINDWVSDATHGAIREIVGTRSLSTESSAVIANALYFKGKWKTSFDSQNTKTKCFNTPGGCVGAPMMRLSANFNYTYISRLRTHAVEIPYELRIREIFSPKANLSGIVENGNVVINSLVHKTRIEVDEQGTVAAAATGAIVIPLMGSTAIVADRPFIFCIYHQETENIIFEGILLNPQEQGGSLELNSPVKTNDPNFRIRSRQFR